MLAIKFQRVGKKHQPSYRIVVAEKRSKLGGPPVEQVGTYDVRTKTPSFRRERVLYWLGVGAKPTVSVHNLFVKHGILSAPKIAVKIKKPEAAPGAEATPRVSTEGEVSAQSTAQAEPAVEQTVETAAEAPKPAAETGV